MEIKVQTKNKRYGELLKELYSGRFSDLSCFLLYKYESIVFSQSDTYFSNNMDKLANDSLDHINIFGRIITLLGELPDFLNIELSEKFFLDNKEQLIEVNIRLLKEKIIKYTKCLNEIEDDYIKDILESFIIEERKNLEILELMQLKYKRNHF